MPTLTKDKTGSFFIVYSVDGKRKWKSLFTKDPSEAKDRFKQCPKSFAKYSLSTTIFKKNPETTLVDAENEFLDYARANLAINTVKHYQYTFKSFNAIIGNPLVNEIDIRMIERYKSQRAAVIEKVSVNIQYRCIKAFFNRLVDWDVIKESPCKRVKPFRLPDVMPAYLSFEDFEKLLRSTKAHPLHNIILLAGMTGLRRSEIVNLKWEDVDFTKRLLIVRNCDTFTTKTGKIRSVPLNSTVYNLLESLPKASQYVFPGDRGGRYNPNFLTERFREIVQKNNFDRKLHFHSLRHTFATFLVTKSVSLYHVQKLLGHSNPRITQIYAHLSNNDLLPSVEQISL